MYTRAISDSSYDPRGGLCIGTGDTLLVYYPCACATKVISSVVIIVGTKISETRILGEFTSANCC